QSARTRVPRWGVLGWLAVAVVVLVMATLWRQNSHLSSTVATLSAEVERQRAESQQARRVAEILHAPDAVPYDVMPVSTKTMPSGKALYSRERSGLIFVASNLNPLPARRTYELWLIPMHGSPIAAGMFKPDAHGMAMVVNPPLPVGVEAKAFAITIEPEDGSA